MKDDEDFLQRDISAKLKLHNEFVLKANKEL